MNDNPEVPHLAPIIRNSILEAFPEGPFVGRVTPADEISGEHFEEERDLYREFYGKTWTEIPSSIIHSYAYSLPLLTEEAFVAFLPAWLRAALTDSDVRESLVHAFSKDSQKDDCSFLNGRMERLNTLQRKVILDFFTHAQASESSKGLQNEIQLALAYLSAIRS